MTFNEFINSPEEMDENSQEYKDFSQCVSSGAYVAFTTMEEILDATPTFDFSSDTNYELPIFKLYKEAIGDVENKEALEKEFMNKLAEFASQTSLIVMDKIKCAMRNSESYKIAVETIEGDVLDSENNVSDET
jgi:hypothetical protein